MGLNDSRYFNFYVIVERRKCDLHFSVKPSTLRGKLKFLAGEVNVARSKSDVMKLKNAALKHRTWMNGLACIRVVDPDSRIVEISAISGREASKPLILDGTTRDGSGKIIYLRLKLNQDQSQRVKKIRSETRCVKEKKEKKKIRVIISSSCIQLPVCSIWYFKSTLLNASRRF